MARELEGYRDCLEDLKEFFGGKGLLYAKDVARYMQTDTRTVVKRFDIPKDGITTVMLARRMCQ